MQDVISSNQVPGSGTGNSVTPPVCEFAETTVRVEEPSKVMLEVKEEGDVSLSVPLSMVVSVGFDSVIGVTFERIVVEARVTAAPDKVSVEPMFASCPLLRVMVPNVAGSST